MQRDQTDINVYPLSRTRYKKATLVIEYLHGLAHEGIFDCLALSSQAVAGLEGIPCIRRGSSFRVPTGTGCGCSNPCSCLSPGRPG